jgi:stringent starvation protein B
MSMSTDQEAQGSSTRPYLIRALHDWCTDNGFTPYLAVYVDRSVQVPQEYVKNNEIVLNASFDATSQLQLGNEFIEFKARFGGKAREIVVPVDHVIAIYARENGQGMAFPVPTSLGGDGVDAPTSTGEMVEGVHAAGDQSLGHDGEDRPAGLRLASGVKPAPARSGPKAVETPAVQPGSSNGDVDPPQPPSSGGPSNAGRPALRRIK